MEVCELDITKDFEHPALRIQHVSEERGRGVVATAPIAADTVVVIAKALFEVEQPTEEAVRTAFEESMQDVSERRRELYDMLQKTPNNDVIGAFQTNAYKTSPNALHKEQFCLYLFPSFFNHDCAPNCVVMHHGDVSVIRTVCDIGEAQELTLSYLYGENYFNYQGRVAYLSKFGFKCSCSLCAAQQSGELDKAQSSLDNALRIIKRHEQDQQSEVSTETGIEDAHAAVIFLKTAFSAIPAGLPPALDGVSTVLAFCLKQNIPQDEIQVLLELARRFWDDLPLSTLPAFEETIKVLLAARKNVPAADFAALRDSALRLERLKYGTLTHVARKLKRQYKQITQ